GAQTALPIWTEFMKRAHQHRQYRAVHPFEPPEGIVTAEIDAETGELATPGCPKVRNEVFLAGTQPVQVCHLHGNGRTQVASWDLPEKHSTDESPKPIFATSDPQPAAKQPRSISIAPQTAEDEKKSNKGFFGRLKDIFK